MMREHAAIMRNMMFEATQALIVCVLIHHLFTDSYLTMRIRSQARNDYDPSFITEALREIQNSDTANQSINLLKDVAVQAYLG